MTNNRFGKEAWELFRSGYSVSIIAIVPFMSRTYVVLHLLHSHFDFSVKFLYLLIHNSNHKNGKSLKLVPAKYQPILSSLRYI